MTALINPDVGGSPSITAPIELCHVSMEAWNRQTEEERLVFVSIKNVKSFGALLWFQEFSEKGFI